MFIVTSTQPFSLYFSDKNNSSDVYTNNNDVLTKDLKTKAVDHLDVISALGFDELLKENIKELLKSGNGPILGLAVM